MKSKTFLPRLYSIWILVVLFVATACENETFVTESDPREFMESPLISFNEIEEMTRDIIEGEVIPENPENGRIKSGLSSEFRQFAFGAEVTTGDNTGLTLEGKLKVNFTFYHALFTIVRGTLNLDNDTRAVVRGAFISDGVVYLIIGIPDFGIIHGIGVEDENQNLTGSFRLLGTNNAGNWDAMIEQVRVQNKNIVEILADDDRFTTLVDAVVAADLADDLSSEGPFTVFAPTNNAFDALESIPGGDTLTNILLYHVLGEKVRTHRLLSEEFFTTLLGEDIQVNGPDENSIVINDSIRITQANIQGTNGVIHVIDAVLIPPSPKPSIVDIAINTPELSTLVEALTAAELVDDLSGDGPFTVFAPTNDAFAALEEIPGGDALVEVLLYHVASGMYTAEDLLELGEVTTLQGEIVTIELKDGMVILNDCVGVKMADIHASNGIIHIIKEVLIPKSFLPSILDIASGEDFTTLKGALEATGLDEALTGDGPFTVFAPTNDAFLGLEALPGGDALVQVLLYHVLSGQFTAYDLLQEGEVTTLQGSNVTIEKQGDEVILNGLVRVVMADIKASNGIVHVIDKVLLPVPTIPNLVETLKLDDDFSTLVGALEATGLDSVLNSGIFTLLAPTNEAFEELESIPGGETLVNVLLYHAIAGDFNLGQLVRQGSVMTAFGEEVTFSRDDENKNKILINGEVEVILRNIETSNGRIHAIEEVLIPSTL